MAAGLPGLGLSGVFFIVSALLMLPIELVCMVQGRSSSVRWAGVLRNAGIALLMIAGVEITYAGLHFVLAQVSGSATSRVVGRGDGIVKLSRALPILPVLGTLGLAGMVIVGAKAADLLSRIPHPCESVD